jgi:hypothetical protein
MYLLYLHDGRPPIPCRDAHQADLLRGIWRAWCGGVAGEMGLREEADNRVQLGATVGEARGLPENAAPPALLFGQQVDPARLLDLFDRLDLGR